MVDNCFGWHVDAHCEGFSRKKNLYQPLGKEEFDYFLGEGKQISVVDCIAIHANVGKEVKLLDLSVFGLESRKRVTYQSFNL